MKYKININLVQFVGIILFIMVVAVQGQESDKLPPGQRETGNFPILRIGEIPDLDRKSWSLKISGEVEHQVTWDWTAFSQLDTVHIQTPFHCVTGWSRVQNDWAGVLIQSILKIVKPTDKARYVTFKGADGYETSLAISECTGPQDILGFSWEGQDLDKFKGGPIRAVIPGKYGFKSAMWLIEMKLTEEQELGYWEKRGYSNSANPWKEERHQSSGD